MDLYTIIGDHQVSDNFHFNAKYPVRRGDLLKRTIKVDSIRTMTTQVIIYFTLKLDKAIAIGFFFDKCCLSLFSKNYLSKNVT